MSTTRALEGLGNAADERFRGAGPLNRFFRKIFPDHWSFMLGEIALYSFVVLLLTGTFLTFWFKPSMAEVVYNGSYTKLQGVTMSEAYASTLHISFDIRGGLLIRQIHHWAALLFFAAIAVHMLRVFFTGAFRKPREINWLIGVTLLVLAMVEGFIGYGLPDDLLSGTGLRITQGMAQGIPVVGTYLVMLMFGGEFPGDLLIPRMFTLHILLIPGIILALVSAHLFIMFHQKHTQYPGKGRTDTNVVGAPMYPYFMAKTGAFFLFTFGVLALMGALMQINPIWLYGPYTPVAITAGAQPDYYMGFLEGAVRIMPGWEITALGHTLTLSILIPAVIVPGILFTGLALYPFIEAWATGDRREHHLLDRPRDNPVRAGIGAAGITFYGVLWAAGGNDIIANKFDIPLFATTWFFRFAVLLGPIIAYVVVKRLCLGLQRRDNELLHHGVESGIIQRLPSGEYVEVTRPVDADSRAALESRKELTRLPDVEEVDDNGVPAPGSLSPVGRLKLRLNRMYTGDRIALPNGHEHEQAPELPAGDGGRRELSRD